MQQTSTSRCKTQRLAKGLTLRELAAKCADAGSPVDFGQLGKIERGEAVPRPALLATLVKLLDLDVADFERKAG